MPTERNTEASAADLGPEIEFDIELEEEDEEEE